MDKVRIWLREFLVSMGRWLGLGLCCWAAIAYSLPALGAPMGDRQLEERVLQVIRDNPEVVVEALQIYQQQQQEEREKQQQAFLQRMRVNPAAVIGDSPTQGSTDREIVLLMFSDFQCPFCQQAHATVKEFMGKHGDRVTLVYKHLPLAIHDQAYPAALVTWAADRQGKFWEFSDALFENQDDLDEELYQKTAKSLGLDLEKFERDRNSEGAKRAIAQDLTMAQALGIGGTPFFVLNGEAIRGAATLEQFEQALARQL